MSNLRYITKQIQLDLTEKMVFLGGPRQVGKTTLSLSLLKNGSPKHPAYLNWDIAMHRQKIISQEFPTNETLLVFDELHKYSRWRNYLKGIYDQYKNDLSILVTGSARLDQYRRGGDSLLGRYHFLRLHPFSLPEISPQLSIQDLNHLLQFGGFPEPFTKANSTHWKRWQRERVDQILREDVRDLERVKEISLLDLLIEALPSRIASPLSLKSLGEDLQVSSQTVDRWIKIFESLYVCFRIAPFGAPKIRAVKKEQKLYFWDWSMVESPGARFENLVASHLLKYCHWKEDTQGDRMELRYIRDTDSREVDFVILKNKKPEFAVEAKSNETALSSHLFYFKQRTHIPKFYQTHLETKDYLKDGIRVLPFPTLCRELGLV